MTEHAARTREADISPACVEFGQEWHERDTAREQLLAGPCIGRNETPIVNQSVTAYQQTGTPLGLVANMPVGRAAEPLKMPHDCAPGIVTRPLHPVAVATSVSAVFPFEGVKFILPTPVPVSAIAA